MPPPRSRPQPDDSRSEASSTKEKLNTNPANPQNGKGRRVGSTAVAGSSLRDVVTAGQNTTGAVGSGATSSDTTNAGIQWSSFDDAVLHGYRYDYRLNTSAAFNKPYNQMVLANSPLGRMSPTMARQKQQKRQSKAQLATACRKHFNGMGVTETEVVVDFLYKVRWQDKNFRMRFTPQRPR